MASVSFVDRSRRNASTRSRMTNEISSRKMTPFQKTSARSVIASKAKQSRLGLRILRLGLDCFAVARNDDHPDSFILLTTPSGRNCNSYAKRNISVFRPRRSENFVCETKTLRRRAGNYLKLLAREIVNSAVPWNIKRLAVVLFRAPYRRAWCRFGIRSRSPRQKHHDTNSDFLEESQSLIFSLALGGRVGRRVRD